MRIKQGVKVGNIKPVMVFAALICQSVFDEANQAFTITSVSDGRHKSTSLHAFGLAFDIRTRDLRGVLPFTIASRLQEALGSEFDVVVEPDHIHVEYNHA